MRAGTFALVVASLIASPVHAGFTLDGLQPLSTERGEMGAHTPAPVEARGSFKHSKGALTPQQKQYEDAELLVDLAYKPVTARGTGSPHAVDGFADDIPFATGMAMILPTGWQLYREPGLDAKKVPNQISFLGGDEWPAVLAQLGDRYALKFHIDWYDQVVLMDHGRPGPLSEAARIQVIAEPVQKPALVAKATAEKDVPAKPNAVDSTAKKATSVSTEVKVFTPSQAMALLQEGKLSNGVPPTRVGAGKDSAQADKAVKAKPQLPAGDVVAAGTKTARASAKPSSQAPIKPDVAKPVWHAHAGSTLRETILAWGKTAGWNIDWQADGLDYPISAAMRVEGSFEEAITKIFSYYRDAERPFRVNGSRQQKLIKVSELTPSRKSA